MQATFTISTNWVVSISPVSNPKRIKHVVSFKYEGRPYIFRCIERGGHITEAVLYPEYIYLQLTATGLVAPVQKMITAGMIYPLAFHTISISMESGVPDKLWKAILQSILEL